MSADGEGWRYDGVHFRGTPVSMVMQDPRDGCLYAALDYGHFGPKLQRSDDDGATWIEVTPPAFPTSDAKDAPAVLNIWALEPAGGDMPGTIWAGTVPAGIFRSDDKGHELGAERRLHGAAAAVGMGWGRQRDTGAEFHGRASHRQSQDGGLDFSGWRAG